MEKQADSYFVGYRLRKCQGENLRSDLTLPIRSLPQDLVTGGIPHAGSWQLLAEKLFVIILLIIILLIWGPCILQCITRECVPSRLTALLQLHSPREQYLPMTDAHH